MQPKSLAELYAESQQALSQATSANYEACMVIKRLVMGELQTSWFTIQEGPNGIAWSWQKPADEAPKSPDTQPN